MSPILTTQGAVLATAMAVSCTVILLAFRLHKSFPSPQFSVISSSSSSSSRRSCISSDRKRKKKNKRVQFAEDVVEPRGNGEEYRRRPHMNMHDVDRRNSTTCSDSESREGGDGKGGGMPANRMALYSGILRDRVRLPLYSY